MKRYLMSSHVGVVLMLILGSLVLLMPALTGHANPIDLPDVNSEWILPDRSEPGRVPESIGSIEIRGTGILTFDPADIETVRPDIFQPGHFSVFDVLVHLSELGQIELQYTFVAELQTHVIQSLNGLEGWWYDAHYAGGSFDRTVVRMDAYPVKDNMSVVFYLENPARLDALYQHFDDEVSNKDPESVDIVIPRVVFRSATETIEFADVTVTAHDVRSDVFQPGIITALDVLLSLGDSGALDAAGLEWRTQEEEIPIVDGYYVVSVQAAGFQPASTGSCVLIHQILGEWIEDHVSPHTHTLSHIHLTGDLEVLVSPQVVEWLWVCL